MAGRKKAIPVDMAAQNRSPAEYRNKDRLGVNTPFDLPCYVICERIMKPTEGHNPERKVFSTELMGHILETDFFSFGVKVRARYDRREQSLTIEVQDEDGTEVIATWSR